MIPPCQECILGNSCYQICSLTEKYFEEKEVTAKAFPNELNIVSPNPSVNRTVSRR